MNCPNCNSDFYDGDICTQCGHSPLIGPGGDEPMAEEPKCPRCDWPNFDGWVCKNCQFQISDKAKKTHGQLLSDDEAEEVRKLLGVDDDDED